jgi:signal transduction protein with GAF and PtsI domain
MKDGQQPMEDGQQTMETEQKIIVDRQHGNLHASPQGKLLQLAQACKTFKNKRWQSMHKAHEPGTRYIWYS